jgi:LPS-assembly lipoprotein
MSMKVRFATIILFVLACSGCGFHLEGGSTMAVGLQQVYIQTADPYTPFLRAFQQRVRQRGGRVVNSREDADVVLAILQDETGQRVLSVSARNLPREYEVYYLLNFSVRGPKGPALEAQALDLTRSYTFDETQVLGKRSEEEILRKALADDLARQVMTRIDTTAPAPQG